MQIGEVIREYRKSKNMTQEEMANYLGVTAPAVNKWEKGVSYPDIMLLSPLARLLGTDVNTLLCFRENLTDEEITRIVKEVSDTFMEEFEKGYALGESYLKEYPNCKMLVLQLAQIYYSNLLFSQIEDEKPYEDRVWELVEEAEQSEDRKISESAMLWRITIYMGQNKLDEVEAILEKLPDVIIDKKDFYPNLYNRKGDYEKASEAYEKQIFNDIQIGITTMTVYGDLCLKQGREEQAEKIAEIYEKAVELFGFSHLYQGSMRMNYALQKQDTEETWKELEAYFMHLQQREIDYSDSPLFSRVNIRNNIRSRKMTMELMLRSIKTDEDAAYLKAAPDYEEKVARLEEILNKG